MSPLPKVWINGELFDDGDAVLRYNDHGITVGDGAFETIAQTHGVAFALTRHLDRLDRSLMALRLGPIDRNVLTQGISAVLGTAGAEGFLRVTVTGGLGPLGSPRDQVEPTMIVAIRDGSLRRDPTRVVVVPWTRNEHGALTGVKSTSYAENVVALAVAAESGATEALFANTAENLCEGTGSNVVVVVEGHLVTPPLSSGCLAGVTRALLLEAMPDVVEGDISMSSLGQIEEMFLVSTAREIQPVSHIDDRPLTVNGPLTRAARDAWLAAYPHPADY